MDHLEEPQRRQERPKPQQLTHHQVRPHQAVSILQALMQPQTKQEQWEASLKVVLWTR